MKGATHSAVRQIHATGAPDHGDVYHFIYISVLFYLINGLISYYLLLFHFIFFTSISYSYRKKGNNQSVFVHPYRGGR